MLTTVAWGNSSIPSLLGIPESPKKIRKGSYSTFASFIPIGSSGEGGLCLAVEPGSGQPQGLLHQGSSAFYFSYANLLQPPPQCLCQDEICRLWVSASWSNKIACSLATTLSLLAFFSPYPHFYINPSPVLAALSKAGQLFKETPYLSCSNGLGSCQRILWSEEMVGNAP